MTLHLAPEQRWQSEDVPATVLDLDALQLVLLILVQGSLQRDGEGRDGSRSAKLEIVRSAGCDPQRTRMTYRQGEQERIECGIDSAEMGEHRTHFDVVGLQAMVQ
jgi:hypothetical protein